MFFIEIDHGEDVNQIMTISKNNCDRNPPFYKSMQCPEIPNFETFFYFDSFLMVFKSILYNTINLEREEVHFIENFSR